MARQAGRAKRTRNGRTAGPADAPRAPGPTNALSTYPHAPSAVCGGEGARLPAARAVLAVQGCTHVTDGQARRWRAERARRAPARVANRPALQHLHRVEQPRAAAAASLCQACMVAAQMHGMHAHCTLRKPLCAVAALTNIARALPAHVHRRLDAGSLWRLHEGEPNAAVAQRARTRPPEPAKLAERSHINEIAASRSGSCWPTRAAQPTVQLHFQTALAQHALWCADVLRRPLGTEVF